MAKIPTILEAGRADGKLVTSDAIFDKNKEMFQSELNDIQDTLTSDNSNKPLSAKQGKILKNLFDSKVIEAGSVPIDTEPIEGNITHLVNSDGLAKEFNKYNTEIILGGVYDVSAHNNSAIFESLSILLSSSNLSTLIPTSVRHGGMSIRFIQGTEQSSDNKYVQYRLTTNEWSTNTENWSFCGNDVYVDNPEFIKVVLDNEGKILWAIKADGSVYYGAGVPPQIIDYINEKIAELSLDEYENIVAFLNNLEKGDKTLQTLLNEKVDKVEGKSLIDSEYASTKSIIDNPEFLEITTDSEDKILEGIRKDGTKILDGDLNV